MTRISLVELYRKDPQLALQHMFDKRTHRMLGLPGTTPKYRENAHMWSSTMGIDGTRYGSYKYVYKDELQTRKYIIELVDYSIGIFYTDVLYDPRNRTYIQKSTDEI